MSKRKREPLQPIDRLERRLDRLCATLLCASVVHGMFLLMGFEGGLLLSLGMTLGAAVLCVIFARFWWLLPSLVALAALAAVAVAVHNWGENMWDAFVFLEEFAEWIGDGIPTREPFTENGSLQLVQLVLATGVWLVCRLLSSRLYFLPVMAAVAAAVPVALYELRTRELTAVVCLGLGCLIVALPRFVHWMQVQKDPAAAAVRRGSLQVLAVPAAAVTLVLAVALTPAEHGAWRNEFLIRRIDDLETLIDTFRGELDTHPVFRIENYGYMPYGEDLGGDIETSADRVLSMQTDEPFLLRGRVHDLYTGSRWGDRVGNGSFRLDSLLWRGRRNEVFGFNLPIGGEEAEALYESLITETEYRLRYISDDLKTLFLAGQVQDCTYSNQSRMEPYFDMQGELFTPYTISFGDTALIQSRVLDREKEGFDEAINELLLLTAEEEDPGLAEIEARYLQLPKKLPAWIGRFAKDVTMGAESDYDKAVALETWLHENCLYTKTPGDVPEGEDFVAWFLKTRQGYCTYYASAMTVMARTLGLPARYVTGFAVGRIEGLNSAYYATDSTAHAWCEVYLKGVGWVTFDPSGWDFEANAELGVIPDDEDEEELLQELEQLKEEAKENTEYQPIEWVEVDWFDDPPTAEEVWAFFLPVLIGFCVVIAALVLWRFRGVVLDSVQRRYALSRVLKRTGGAYGAALEEYYRDLLRQLKLLGVSGETGDTTYTLCLRADRQLDLRGETCEQLAEIVGAVHYGGRDVSEGMLDLAFRIHGMLERRLRSEMSQWAYFFKRVLFQF